MHSCKCVLCSGYGSKHLHATRSRMCLRACASVVACLVCVCVCVRERERERERERDCRVLVYVSTCKRERVCVVVYMKRACGRRPHVTISVHTYIATHHTYIHMHIHMHVERADVDHMSRDCLLYTSPSPRDRQKSRMPSSA